MDKKKKKSLLNTHHITGLQRFSHYKALAVYLLHCRRRAVLVHYVTRYRYLFILVRPGHPPDSCSPAQLQVWKRPQSAAAVEPACSPEAVLSTLTLGLRASKRRTSIPAGQSLGLYMSTTWLRSAATLNKANPLLVESVSQHATDLHSFSVR